MSRNSLLVISRKKRMQARVFIGIVCIVEKPEKYIQFI